MKSKNIFFSIVLTALITCLVTNTVRDAMHTQSNQGLDRKVKTVADIISNYSIYENDETKMADAAAAAMVHSLDDPYTNYYSKDEYSDLMSEIQNSYVGIGVIIGVDVSANKLIVISPIEGQAAEKSGILAGDYITAVDGTPYTGDRMEEAVSVIKGRNLKDIEGTSVTLTVERDGKVFDIGVQRGVVSRESVSAKIIEEDIGYIRITQFNSSNKDVKDSKDTFDEFSEKMAELKNKNIKSLVIDVRNNPGGDLSVVTKICDYLLPQGVITYTEDKNGRREYYESEQGSIDLPMAVLVNGGSASASEVLSGALKDFDKAELVGEKTFGKGVVQTVIPLYDGSGLTVTSAKYYTPTGVCIHDMGIEPDILVPMDTEKSISQLSYEEDVQLKKAVEILKNK